MKKKSKTKKNEAKRRKRGRPAGDELGVGVGGLGGRREVVTRMDADRDSRKGGRSLAEPGTTTAGCAFLADGGAHRPVEPIETQSKPGANPIEPGTPPLRHEQKTPTHTHTHTHKETPRTVQR